MADDFPLPDTAVLFEDAACGLMLTAKDGRILLANRTLCRWLGYSADELVGQMRLQDLLNMGGRIFHQTHWAPLMRMQGSVAEVKLDLRCRDGSELPFILNGSVREWRGQQIHDVALFVARDRHNYERELMRARDRAEELLQRQLEAQRALGIAEARLRVALEAAQLHVWQIDPATGDRQFDGGLELLIGAGDAKTITDAEFRELVHPADRLQEEQALAAALDQDRPYRCVFRLDCPDGQERTVLSMGRGRRDEHGALLWFVGVIQDITELSRQRAEAEDRALLSEQMMGIVSHDLRNPLAVVRLASEALAGKSATPAQQRLITHIGEATRRSLRMIEDLLDFTLIRLGRGLSVNRRLVEPQQLIGTSIDELRLAFPGRELLHEHSGDGECALDADRVVQLIGNLIANAVSYGEPGTPVSVTSQLQSETLLVRVHNRGTPVSPGDQQALFEPMVRGKDRQDVSRSVGLGLFIVREIARAHGGDVWLESSAEAGTTFVVRMPASASI